MASPVQWNLHWRPPPLDNLLYYASTLKCPQIFHCKSGPLVKGSTSLLLLIGPLGDHLRQVLIYLQINLLKGKAGVSISYLPNKGYQIQILWEGKIENKRPPPQNVWTSLLYSYILFSSSCLAHSEWSKEAGNHNVGTVQRSHLENGILLGPGNLPSSPSLKGKIKDNQGLVIKLQGKLFG